MHKIDFSWSREGHVQEAIKEMLTKHWQGWLDTGIPALKGKTPREAVKSAEGREAVLALHFILQTSVSGTLSSVSNVTQVVSFSLIALLGLGILIKNGWEALQRLKAGPVRTPSRPNEKTRGLLPLAMAVGLVPCPGVVMVMLFCLSMGAMTLGLALAACVALGMAATISLVVLAVVTGKAGLLKMMPEGKVALVESVVGLLSGIAIALLGTMFLVTTLHYTGL